MANTRYCGICGKEYPAETVTGASPCCDGPLWLSQYPLDDEPTSRIDPKALLALWNHSGEFPVCDDGMALAKTLLEKAGEIVDTLGTDRINELRKRLLTSLDSLVSHQAECCKCNEV